MKRKVNKKAKRRFLVLSCVVIGVVSFFVNSIFKDWVQIVENKSQVSSLGNKYTDLLNEEESLSSEVAKLHDIDYVARYAREKYMYSLPNEIIIKIPNATKEN